MEQVRGATSPKGEESRDLNLLPSGGGDSRSEREGPQAARAITVFRPAALAA